ncbi:SusC/RagA family TonB-linked outer membrane protein [Pedobacter hiemivivus]|uniref:SusC/RagA family TonB-linked outer membrane protein n=1 Tax=Pedobacter hiemivivus TaxID=2530454 RepID=A0A4R0NBV8_9SPHI|nr:SusC/RagA family TonB-linked outer membrane protein [Pedobacter hiemivivus]TCC97799.1 SusC/RagA family TonB-linked outer membrane protein [Pedobacter hiemivivus]
MKLTTIILFISLVQVSAKGYSQITLNEKNAPLTKVLEAIEKQSGYVFLYNESSFPVNNLSITTNNATITEVLNKYFKPMGIAYQIIGKNITLKPTHDIVIAMGAVRNMSLIDVQGTVRDSLGKPIPGVTVRLVSNSISFKMKKANTTEPADNPVLETREHVTITNRDGKYTLSAVDDQDMISFSSLGYITQNVSVAGRKTINIVMKEEVRGLNEVTINTGIYTRKANSFTGSTLVIKGEDLKKVGNANIFQALKNISPSMVLDNFAMGSSPNALPDIQLRGTSTFPAGDNSAAGLKGNYERSPNQPLFILDGFEASLERIFDLDMNRVESITILKDAASKAIYGSKAANGVVVIETKKVASTKPLVTYNSSVDLELPDLRSYNLTNSLQKLEAERIDGFYLTHGSKTADELIALQQLYNSRKKLALEGLDTYWLAKPLQNGVGQKHALSVELGGSGLNVMADVSYRDVKGAMIGSGRKNISGSVMTSYRLNNFLFRNIMSVNKNNTVESPYGTFSEYAQMNPYWRAENIDGSIPFYAEYLGENPDEKFTNPLYNSTVKSKNTTSYLNFTNNFYLEWTLIPGLKATTRLGVDIKNSDADEFYPSSHTKFVDFTSDVELQRKGSYQVNNGKGQTLSGDLNLNYGKTINKHVLFANVGFNVSEFNYNEVVHKAEGFPSDRVDNILFARGYTLDSKPSGSSAINRELGFLGAFSYMYDNRFLSDLTVRTSASSQFGADKRWAPFWSFGLGWNVHNERFLKNFTALKQLKLRGSLGSTGNSNFLNNQAIATYSYYQDALYQGFPGSYLVNLANSNLQWESKFDYNAGLDANIGGLSLKFDYYKSFTENLITNVSLPNSTGFNTVKDNLGKVQNTGFEIYGSYILYADKGNFFTLNASIETNKNKIIELSNAMKAFNANMDKLAADQGNSKPVKKYEDGMSMNAIWAVPSLGIDPSTGNEIYVDRNGHTTFIWNANDMVARGNSTPDYQGTLGFSGEYKGIGASLTARFLGGGQMYNQTLVDRVENVDMAYNVDERVITGRWTTPGQNALFKRLGTYSVQNEEGGASGESLDEKTRATTRFIQNRNEVTLSALNIYYLFNKKITDKLGIRRLKVGFNMNELTTFSSIVIERGTSYPFARTMSFNLSATF